MDDDWDDSTAAAGGFDSEPIDPGRNFSRGRGFTRSNCGLFDMGNNGRETTEDDNWGDADNERNGGRGSGRSRGGRGSSFKSQDYNANGSSKFGGRSGNNGDNEWGTNGNQEDDWGLGGGDDNENSGFGGGRGRGRGRGRGGRGRGGRGGRDNDGGGDGGGGDDWGSNDNGWGDCESARGGRGGRGGRGDRGGGDGPEKPREVYIPPDPTEDATEMFSTAITSGINFDKYDNIPVEVTGDKIVTAINSFEESGLRPILIDNIKRSGYTRPTPIQKTAIPIVLAGRDVMACAQTGSGKTAAFLLPIINDLIMNPTDLIMDSSHCEPQVIIISPTRELASQIHLEARKFAFDSVIKCVVAYGGTAVYHQAKQLMNGCHILVATPGRLNDFVGKGRVSFNSVRFVVLDEADRMLDMGFLPAVEQMLNHESMVPTGERQTLMFSATFPEEVQHLASKFLYNYLFITVGIVGGACTDVQQVFYEVDKFAKRNKLIELLREDGEDRTLVFVETKRNADFIATYLSENNLRTTSIHGDRLQREREEALSDFKSGRRSILVATDVAARGLDIKNVKHVINYDLPKSIDEYVHRIGRTGRVGNSGKATSFYDGARDGHLANDLMRILRQANQNIPDWLRSAASGASSGGYNSGSFGGRDVRGDDFGQATNFSNQQTEELEEEW